MGIDVNDGRLLRPSDEPAKAEMVFDWDESVDNAMFRRVELRRQKWAIKRREMELLAARNQLLMRLDLVGQYRWRGFGDDLFGNNSVANGSAFHDLYQGDLQGWGLGLELSTPIGNRIGHAAVRQAELSLSRERALLREQERGVLAELSEAFNELDPRMNSLGSITIELSPVAFDWRVNRLGINTAREFCSSYWTPKVGWQTPRPNISGRWSTTTWGSPRSTSLRVRYSTSPASTCPKGLGSPPPTSRPRRTPNDSSLDTLITA